MKSQNLEQLLATAECLLPVLGELVFVGGAITGLLITDDAAGEPRATMDVDTIAEIMSYREYVKFGERLRVLGFVEDTREAAPVCRWVRRNVVLDVMPLDEGILGFSNRWYRGAMATATARLLREGLEIRVINAPYFLATKLEAFKGRGNGDFSGSHDLEDLICVIDGRPSLAREIQEQEASLVEYLRGEFRALIETDEFVDALPGYLFPDTATQSRIGIILERLRAISDI